MLDVMSELPLTTSYHGFDIDLSQVPPSAWLPSNMSFSKLDLHDDEDIPPGLEEAFDIINIRMLLLVVKDNDPAPILRKMARMLKPGGWLQWTEGSHESYLDFVRAGPDLSTGSAMKALRDRFASRSDHRFRSGWSLDLPRFFESVGFENVQGEQKHGSDFLPWLAFTTDVVVALYQELIDAMPFGLERDECQILYDRAARESLAGTAWRGTRINVIGRKPGVVLGDVS